MIALKYGEFTSDAWFAYSRNRRVTWRERHLAGPFNLRTAPLIDGRYFLGDYFGLAGRRGGFDAAYVLARPLSRLGPTDVFFSRIEFRRRTARRGAGRARTR